MSIFSSGGVTQDGEVVSSKPIKNYKNIIGEPSFVISPVPGMLVSFYAKNNGAERCYLQFFDQVDPLTPGQEATRTWIMNPAGDVAPSLWLVESATPALVGIQIGWSTHETLWNPVTISDTGSNPISGLPNPPEKIFHAVYA